MIEDYQEQHRKRVTRMRSVMDYTMGALLILIGSFFLIYGMLGYRLRGHAHDTIDYFIGVLFVLYGIWRIYRGYKKDYFR